MTINQSIANFQSLSKKHDEFLAEITPVRDSYIAFITDHRVDPWIRDMQMHTDDMPEVDHFELDLSNTDNGVMFSAFVQSYDGGDSLYFVVPFAYIENPQKWEEDMLAKMASDQKAVEDAYDALAPGVREKHNMEIYIQTISGEMLFGALVEEGNCGLTLNHPAKKEFITNSFSFNLETGEFTQKTLM